MTGEYITFESAAEWDHLHLSEELFRRKHQQSFVKFKKDVTSLAEDVQSYLSFVDDVSQRGVKSEVERVSNSKKRLHQCKEERDKIKNEIIEVSKENNNIKISLEETNERLRSVEGVVNELIQLKKAFAAEVKSTFNAFIFAKDYYKEILKMYFTIEGNIEAEEVTILIQLFTTKRRKDSKYSVTITKTKSDNKYRLVDMKPRLQTYSQLCKRLEETNDVSGLLCCVRKCFLNLQCNK